MVRLKIFLAKFTRGHDTFAVRKQSVATDIEAILEFCEPI